MKTTILGVLVLMAALVGCSESKKGAKRPEKTEPTAPVTKEETSIEPVIDDTAAKQTEEEEEPAEVPTADTKAAAELAEKERIAAAARKAERDGFLAIQERAVGTEFAEIELRDRTYATASIKAIDDEGIRIVHKDGALKIKWAEVPPGYQKEWGYDEKRDAELESVKTEIAAGEEPPTEVAGTTEPTPMETAKEEARLNAIKRNEIQRKHSELDDKLRKLNDDIVATRSKRIQLASHYRAEDSGRAPGAKTHSTIRQKNLGQLDAHIAKLDAAIANTQSLIRKLKTQ